MKVKILTLGLAFLLMLGSVLSAEKKEYTISWQKFFPDHLERVYIIMEDGIIFSHTSHYETKIHINMGWLEEELKKFKNKNHSIKKIKVVIHNHRLRKHFSLSDHRQYNALKEYGFNGLFLLYCHRTKEVYDIERNEKSK